MWGDAFLGSLFSLESRHLPEFRAPAKARTTHGDVAANNLYKTLDVSPYWTPVEAQAQDLDSGLIASTVAAAVAHLHGSLAAPFPAPSTRASLSVVLLVQGNGFLTAASCKAETEQRYHGYRYHSDTSSSYSPRSNGNGVANTYILQSVFASAETRGPENPA